MKTFTIEATIPEGCEVHPDDVLLAITGLGIDGKITVVSDAAGDDGSQLSFEWSRAGADSCFAK
jgi:hypothetical protein